jgi:hypothetical protein
MGDLRKLAEASAAPSVPLARNHSRRAQSRGPELCVTRGGRLELLPVPATAELHATEKGDGL